MSRTLKVSIAGVAVSCFLFPVGFTFIPPNINSKMLLAVLGMAFFMLDTLQSRNLDLRKDIFGSFILACIFSVTCYVSVYVNNTDDYSYAGYIVTYFVWLFSGYAVYRILQLHTPEPGIRHIVYYCAAVCVAQCILALMIDRIVPLQIVVDAWVRQGQEFTRQVHRLYGIGASLDSAGVRFAVVSICIAGVVMKETTVRKDFRLVSLLLSAFFTIGLVGNMISRTTTTGTLLGLGVFSFYGLPGVFSKGKQYRAFYLSFMLVCSAAILVASYKYVTDPDWKDNLRFGFEGFFNFFEKGSFSTGSTDKLNTQMWVWPKTIQGWIIGTGRFDNFVYSTDIGYCRFTLYCGLVGFLTFCFFFAYNCWVSIQRFPEYRLVFVLLLLLSFIIWIKVSTDLFFLYALILFFLPLGKNKNVHSLTSG